MMLFYCVPFALWKQCLQFIDHAAYPILKLSCDWQKTRQREPISLSTLLQRRSQSRTIKHTQSLSWSSCYINAYIWCYPGLFAGNLEEELLRCFGRKQEISSLWNYGEQYLNKLLKVLAAEELINQTTLKLRVFTHQKNPLGTKQTGSNCEKTLQCIFNK